MPVFLLSKSELGITVKLPLLGINPPTILVFAKMEGEAKRVNIDKVRISMPFNCIFGRSFGEALEARIVCS
jgi:hypothetical protein